MNFYGQIFHFSRHVFAVPHQSETWSELDGETKYFCSGKRKWLNFNLNWWIWTICGRKIYAFKKMMVKRVQTRHVSIHCAKCGWNLRERCIAFKEMHHLFTPKNWFIILLRQRLKIFALKRHSDQSIFLFIGDVLHLRTLLSIGWKPLSQLNILKCRSDFGWTLDWMIKSFFDSRKRRVFLK